MERSAKGSRERILAAAEEVFAAKGIDGARVDEIAHLAQVNKRMLYHYFNSKEDLYTYVLKVNFEKSLAAGKKAFSEKGDLKQQVAEAIRNYFYFLAANPNYPRLMAWEALQGGNYARKVLPEIWEEGLPSLKAILEEGVARGVFRPDLDLKQVLASITTLCSGYFTNKDILAILWEEDPLSPGNREKRLKHIIDLILRSIVT
ncbi:TetR/AcrR family transcriptional regulator [Neomoorella thermoacetica]|uniref:TetR/AcrR family transcriptional regulator n=1 Tax=Neomoorella thermoacetica TaxID=1525 RepID=UPI0008FB4CCE|nr:TetR/AcrR family transcriptional regulator [Moorella thermoacetica]OIQ54193.1 HTH-type transcriptional repressor NicS [Moorella thermoacetica]